MRWGRVLIGLCAALGLSGCDMPTVSSGATSGASVVPGFSPELVQANFSYVVSAVEPIAEQECRNRTTGMNCDFLIAVDARRNAQPNAFQSLDREGRPVITFTASLIESVGNVDELAFVMSHEAAHHIRNHLARQQRNAEAGAVVFAGLATLTGGSALDVENAQRLGAAVGARSYSKEFELEADQLGTVIAYRAGFNPLIGAGFFTQVPEPGDRFLWSHPPNADRLDMVRRTMAGMTSG